MRHPALLLLTLFFGLFYPSCSPGHESVEAPAQIILDDEDRATLASLRREMTADPAACQGILLDSRHASGLRDAPEFRSLIEEQVRQHRISSLQLVGDGEPGEWIDIVGRVEDAQGEPVAGALIRIFATDDSGRYHPKWEGERIPRIFGSLVSDDQGQFHFRTIRPGPYPGTRQARHIHIAVRKGNQRLSRPGYAVFDDDPLLTEPQNAEQRGEAIQIRMQRQPGKKVGTFVLPIA